MRRILWVNIIEKHFLKKVFLTDLTLIGHNAVVQAKKNVEEPLMRVWQAIAGTKPCMLENTINMVNSCLKCLLGNLLFYYSF